MRKLSYLLFFPDFLSCHPLTYLFIAVFVTMHKLILFLLLVLQPNLSNLNLNLLSHLCFFGF